MVDTWEVSPTFHFYVWAIKKCDRFLSVSIFIGLVFYLQSKELSNIERELENERCDPMNILCLSNAAPKINSKSHKVIDCIMTPIFEHKLILIEKMDKNSANEPKIRVIHSNNQIKVKSRFSTEKAHCLQIQSDVYIFGSILSIFLFILSR